MLELTSMEADNLFCFEHIERRFSPGLWYVKGINEDYPGLFDGNGAGKSSLQEIIKWVFTNETSKDVFVDDVVNWKHNKNGRGSISGRYDGKTFTISRYRKHDIYNNEVHVFIDGKQEERNAEGEIKKILKMSKTLFFHSCFLSQEFTTNFVSMNSAGRRGIFEESFRLDTLSTAYTIAKKKNDELSKELQSLYSSISYLSTEVADEEAQLQELESMKVQWDKDTEVRDRETETQMNILKADIKAIKHEVTKEEPALIERVQRLRQQAAALSSLKASPEDVGKPCPFCRKTFTQGDYDKLAPANANGATLNRSIISGELVEAESRLAYLSSRKMMMSQKEGTLEALHNKSGSDNRNPYSSQVKNKNILIDEKKFNLNILNLDVSEKVFNQLTLEYWVTAFAPTGPLRMSIIQYYLPILNSSLKKYTNDILGERWSVLLEGYSLVKSSGRYKEDLNVKIMLDGEMKRYNNLSSGQKCRVDLAIFLAYQEVIFKFTQPVNILMIDEAFSSVDPSGVKTLIELLVRNLPPNRCVDFVTQNREYESMFSKKLIVRMKDDVSTLEEVLDEEVVS